ncbi:MAG: DUF3842 family protein [Desulfobacterales bacterium]|nr:DUF3842 family protein [Desulfobacterales bacterium]
MVVMVMDGQGGGIGAVIIKSLREQLNRDNEILALGTNSSATARMMKAGANRGATGENAIVRASLCADIIVGPLAIIMPNSMMGEVTTPMAEAVSSCGARKILIPLSQEKVTLAGFSGEPLPHLVNHAVQRIKELMNDV